jgi:dienelactone hydrolase
VVCAAISITQTNLMDTTEQVQRRTELYRLLGDLPDGSQPIRATVLDRSEDDGYYLEKLVLELNGSEIVPAYFVKPKAADERLPCILYNHAHGGDFKLGKDELLHGREHLPRPPYAKALTANGYAALCIDHWCFGERRGRTESATYKEMIWRGQVMWGMMVYDSLRAIDYLVSRPDVDAERIGTLGLSMGSTMAWWVAALDTRIKVCVDLCCLTDFQALIDSGGLDGHGIYYYVPSLMKHFTASQINALIAPRAHLGLAGNRDPLTPRAGLDRIDRDLKQAYKEAGNEAAWRMDRYEIGHFETVAMRTSILQFLKQWL